MTVKPFFISFLILIVSAVLVVGIDSRGIPFVAATNLEKLPMEIAGYTAQESSFPQAVYDELNADLHVYRKYSSLVDGTTIDLYIGYYGTAKGGRTPHNPYACFPSSGWAIMDERNVVLHPDTYADSVEVNSLHVSKDAMHNIVGHWYQSAGDKVLKDGLQQNVQRFLGKVLRNRNDGAFIRISSVSDEKSIDATREKIEAFSEVILALLPHYWPEEKDSSVNPQPEI